MITSWDELDGYGLSGRLWKKLAEPAGRGFASGGGNPVFGHFDDFIRYGNTSLYDGHIILATTGCSAAQIASELHHPGIVRLSIDGNAANDECVLQLGAGLDVGAFKAASTDLAFEAYLRVSAITAAKWSWFVGLATGGSAGAAITDKMFADTTPTLYATNSFIGFQHLYGEAGPIDGMYQKSGQTKVDGAVNTDLDTLHTAVADTWVKLGFRFFAHPKKLAWFVDGVEKASIGAGAIDAAAFPDDVFLQPTIGIKDAAGDTGLTLDLDWWACAQMV